MAAVHAMSSFATLLLVRHGESVANVEQRFTLKDDEPLTAVGVQQARATGSRLAESCRASTLYASPLARALETARLIGELVGLEPRVVLVLHEQRFGELRGRPYTEFARRVAGVTERDRWNLSAPGGESLRQVAARVGPAIDQIAADHPGQEVIVVSHGGVMAALRAHAAGSFEAPPQSTTNAGGYRLIGRSAAGYRGPLPLFAEGEVGQVAG